MIWRPCFPFCSCSMFGVVVWRNWSKFRINQSSMKIPRKEAKQIDRNKKKSKSTQKNYFAKNVVVVISRSNRIWIINECGITLANTSKYHAIQNIAGGRWQKAKMCRNFVRRNLSYVEFTFHWLFSQRNTTYMRKVFRFLHVTFFFLFESIFSFSVCETTSCLFWLLVLSLHIYICITEPNGIWKLIHWIKHNTNTHKQRKTYALKYSETEKSLYFLIYPCSVCYSPRNYSPNLHSLFL